MCSTRATEFDVIGVPNGQRFEYPYIYYTLHLCLADAAIFQCTSSIPLNNYHALYQRFGETVQAAQMHACSTTEETFWVAGQLWR